MSGFPPKHIRKYNIPTICLVHGNEIIIKNDKHFKRVHKTLNLTNSIVCNSNYTVKLIGKFNLNFPIIRKIYPGVSSFENIEEIKINHIEGSPILLRFALSSQIPLKAFCFMPLRV